jgi:hypothetical protein
LFSTDALCGRRADDGEFIEEQFLREALKFSRVDAIPSSAEKEPF